MRGIEHIQLARRDTPNDRRNASGDFRILAVEDVFRRLVTEIENHVLVSILPYERMTCKS